MANVDIRFRYSPLGQDSELSAATLSRLGLQSAFGPILIVTMPDLSFGSVRAVAAYVTEHSSVLFPPYSADTAESTRTGGGGCALVVEVAGGDAPTLLSDRSFWTLVCGGAEEPGDVVEPFVRSVMAAAESDGDRLFDRDIGLVGEDALYAWFDTCFGYVDEFRPYNKDECFHRDEFRRFHDVFLDYLRVCDMDHEVRQNRYIDATLSLVDRYMDGPDSVRLAAFRLTNGQEGFDDATVRRWTRRRSMLKLLIDDVLTSLSGEQGPLRLGPYSDGWDDPKRLAMLLCELVESTYGSDDAGGDVADYLLEVAGLDIRAFRDEQTATRPDLVPNTTKRLADADLDRPGRSSDTGFHRCVEVGVWQRIDAVE